MTPWKIFHALTVAVFGVFVLGCGGNIRRPRKAMTNLESPRELWVSGPYGRQPGHLVPDHGQTQLGA